MSSRIEDTLRMLDIFLPIPCCWPDKREREVRRINSDIEKQIRQPANILRTSRSEQKMDKNKSRDGQMDILSAKY